MEWKSTQYQGSVINYRTTGEGKTVLLLHGFGEDGSVFDLLTISLKHKFRFLVPDLPGSGKSLLIPGANIETYAEVARAVADAERVDAGAGINLIGHSMGGYAALAFAEKYPDKLNSLGLLHSSAFADTDERKEMRTKAIGFVKEKGPLAFLKTSTPGLFNEQYINDNKVYIDELIEKSSSFTAEALIQYYEAMIARPDRTAVLKSFARPVLFIIGEHDKAIPLQTSLQQCYLPARSQVVILEKSAHMGMYEEPAKVLAAIQDFLNLV